MAGYFGWAMAGDPVIQTWDVNNPADMAAVFTRLMTEVDDTLNDMDADRLFLLAPGARDYSSIPLVFYEGGQGLVAWGINADLDRANAVFDAANRDSRMGNRYQQLLDGWRSRGGDVLFNHYVNCRTYTAWGRLGRQQSRRHGAPISVSAAPSSTSARIIARRRSTPP